MPQIFRIGPYSFFFWPNEGDPLEPVHVHIVSGKPRSNATKIWITQSGKSLLCNNNSRFPERILRDLMRIAEANSELIVEKWISQFGEIRYFC